MKQIIAALLIFILLFVAVAAIRTEIIDSNDLTLDMLTHRKGTILVEKCFGIVTDSEKHGRILNVDSEYNYISYKYVNKANENDIILTYFVYNPMNNVEDDILFRLDFVL